MTLCSDRWMDATEPDPDDPSKRRLDFHVCKLTTPHDAPHTCQCGATLTPAPFA